jgi:hypothetical protein
MSFVRGTCLHAASFARRTFAARRLPLTNDIARRAARRVVVGEPCGLGDACDQGVAPDRGARGSSSRYSALADNLDVGIAGGRSAPSNHADSCLLPSGAVTACLRCSGVQPLLREFACRGWNEANFWRRSPCQRSGADLRRWTRTSSARLPAKVAKPRMRRGPLTNGRKKRPVRPAARVEWRVIIASRRASRRDRTKNPAARGHTFDVPRGLKPLLSFRPKATAHGHQSRACLARFCFRKVRVENTRTSLDKGDR